MTTAEMIERLNAGPLSGDPVFEEAAERLERIMRIWRSMEFLMPDTGSLHVLGNEMSDLLKG